MKTYAPGQLLEVLDHSIKHLRPMLADRSRWDSLIINRRKPYTYRVFTQLDNGMRLCLHRFEPCDTHEAFAHPHPWPGAFKILMGEYRMMLGYSCNGREDSNYKETATLILSRGSQYEIIDPLTWHAVIPTQTTYTIMINDEAWDASFAHKDVRTTKGKDLEKMEEPDLIHVLELFDELTVIHNP